MTLPPAAFLRPGRDEDGQALIELIAACWADYPGCVMDPDENAHLRAPATHTNSKGGTLTVAEAAGRVVGCISTVPAPDGDLELKGLYVQAAHRGTGLARALLRTVETEARERGARRLILWSDTRFLRAHRFYEREGFVAAGPIRALNDRSNSLEYPYAKPMRPRAVQRLAAAAARSASLALAALVEDEVYWQATARLVAKNERILIAAWYQGTLSGALVLDLPATASTRHRADLTLVHVVASARRIGLAGMLLDAAEQAARGHGRILLTVRPDVGSPGEGFLQSAGFHRAGELPGYKRDEQGRPIDSIEFWRTLEGGETS